MSNDLSSLGEDHIRQLGRIVETLEQSTFDFLQIEVGDLKVTVGKGDIKMPEPGPAAPVQAPSPQAAPAPAAALAPSPAEPAAPASPASADGAPVTIEITSPIMGMFYAQPEPGAPPFVAVGAMVEEDSTVGLVEVMKTFNAVKAGVRGKIVELCIPETQLVEYGQVLFRVTPE